MSGSGFKGSGITDPFLTPDAPTIDSVTADEILSAVVNFSAPATDIDISSYVVSAKQSDGTSVSAQVYEGSPATITLTAGGTTTFAIQALNTYGAGQFSGYSNSTTVYAGQELYGWGRNDVGQVGNISDQDVSSPVQVGSDITWSTIGIGGEHCLAVKSNGTLWAWGSRLNGELGDNTRNANGRSSPVQIGALTNWTQADGAENASIALNADGEIYCWGNNSRGAVGDGTNTNRSSPVQVGALTNWTQVVGNNGDYLERCYAFNSDGEMWAWGANVEGALGSGDTTDKSSPVQIAGSWSTVSPGRRHTLGIKTDGTLWAWGPNDDGELGINQGPVEQSSPTQVGALTNWSSVSAGGDSSFAIKTDGTLWAWGENANGALGDGTIIDRSSPVQIGSGTDWAIVSNSSAIKTDGTLWSWGRDPIGDGTVVNYSSPVQIGSDNTWSELQTTANVSAGLGSRDRTAIALLKVTS